MMINAALGLLNYMTSSQREEVWLARLITVWHSAATIAAQTPQINERRQALSQAEGRRANVSLTGCPRQSRSGPRGRWDTREARLSLKSDKLTNPEEVSAKNPSRDEQAKRFLQSMIRFTVFILMAFSPNFFRIRFFLQNFLPDLMILKKKKELKKNLDYCCFSHFFKSIFCIYFYHSFLNFGHFFLILFFLLRKC